MLPLSGELLWKLDVKSNDEVSSLGRILGQRHPLSCHHFFVRRAGVFEKQIRDRKMVVDAD